MTEIAILLQKHISSLRRAMLMYTKKVAIWLDGRKTYQRVSFAALGEIAPYKRTIFDKVIL